MRSLKLEVERGMGTAEDADYAEREGEKHQNESDGQANDRRMGFKAEENFQFSDTGFMDYIEYPNGQKMAFTFTDLSAGPKLEKIANTVGTETLSEFAYEYKFNGVAGRNDQNLLISSKGECRLALRPAYIPRWKRLNFPPAPRSPPPGHSDGVNQMLGISSLYETCYTNLNNIATLAYDLAISFWIRSPDFCTDFAQLSEGVLLLHTEQVNTKFAQYFLPVISHKFHYYLEIKGCL